MARADRRRDAVQLLVDLTVYAPIGLLSLARDHLPEVAATGRGRVQQRLTLARFVGELAVRQGRREIERRVAGPPVAPSRPPTPHAPVVDLDAERHGADREAPHATTAPPSVASHHTLPIDGYESLAASQVVARLASLGVAELDAIEAFERAHRNRRTVLGRIAQVRAGE